MGWKKLSWSLKGGDPKGSTEEIKGNASNPKTNRSKKTRGKMTRDQGP